MTAEELNAKYTQACAELGNLTFQLLDLTDQFSQLQTTIEDVRKKVQGYRELRTSLQNSMTELQKEIIAGTPQAELTVDDGN